MVAQSDIWSTDLTQAKDARCSLTLPDPTIFLTAVFDSALLTSYTFVEYRTHDGLVVLLNEFVCIFIRSVINSMDKLGMLCICPVYPNTNT